MALWVFLIFCRKISGTVVLEVQFMLRCFSRLVPSSCFAREFTFWLSVIGWRFYCKGKSYLWGNKLTSVFCVLSEHNWTLILFMVLSSVFISDEWEEQQTFYISHLVFNIFLFFPLACFFLLSNKRQSLKTRTLIINIYMHLHTYFIYIIAESFLVWGEKKTLLGYKHSFDISYISALLRFCFNSLC